MICEEGWADKFASYVFLFTSNPIFRSESRELSYE